MLQELYMHLGYVGYRDSGKQNGNYGLRVGLGDITPIMENQLEK